MSERQSDLTVKDVAQEMKVSTDTVRRLAMSHRLPGYQVGRRWRFTRAAVDQFRRGPARPVSEPFDAVAHLAERDERPAKSIKHMKGWNKFVQ